MPYIQEHERYALNPLVSPNNPGQLNFAITVLLLDYLEQHGINYTNLNAVVGVLECAKLEMYRRMAAPYEDMKIEENGDVY